MSQRIRQVNCITVNTDASFDPAAKVGGYAFYVVCDAFRLAVSGPFRAQPLSAKEAEEMCIGNALSAISRQPDLPAVKHLIINGDCKYAFSSISQGHDNKRVVPGKVREILDNLLKHIGNPTVQFRHVKAHTDATDARSKANAWCDAEAKKWMRKSKKQFKPTKQ